MSARALLLAFLQDASLTFPSISTRSISSSILEGVDENGRQYCNSTYFMPNDSAEQTRLSIQHQVYLSVLNNSLTAQPLDPSVLRILDVGAGPGEWAVAIAEQQPDADVVAVDIGVFALDDELPGNVSFQIDDLSSDWDFSERFDFIHIRGLAGAFSDWPRVYAEAFKNLAPGGQIEVADVDWVDVFGEEEETESEFTSAFEELMQKTLEASSRAGRPLSTQHLQASYFQEAGFENIRDVEVGVPVGTWFPSQRKKAMGKMWLVCVMESLEAQSLRLLTRELGWTAEQVRELCQRAKEELLSGSHDRLTMFHFVTATKPGGDE